MLSLELRLFCGLHDFSSEERKTRKKKDKAKEEDGIVKMQS